MFSELIKSSGRTRADWASDIGISPSYLSDLLNGKKYPSLQLAVKIERVTGGAVVASDWVPDDGSRPQDYQEAS